MLTIRTSKCNTIIRTRPQLFILWLHNPGGWFVGYSETDSLPAKWRALRQFDLLLRWPVRFSGRGGSSSDRKSETHFADGRGWIHRLASGGGIAPRSCQVEHRG